MCCRALCRWNSDKTRRILGGFAHQQHLIGTNSPLVSWANYCHITKRARPIERLCRKVAAEAVSRVQSCLETKKGLIKFWSWILGKLNLGSQFNFRTWRKGERVYPRIKTPRLRAPFRESRGVLRDEEEARSDLWGQNHKRIQQLIWVEILPSSVCFPRGEKASQTFNLSEFSTFLTLEYWLQQYCALVIRRGLAYKDSQRRSRLQVFEATPFLPSTFSRGADFKQNIINTNILLS